MIYTVNKKTLLWISLFSLIFWLTFAKTNNTICTMEYAPVCGSVQVQCIKAPCPPIEQTFWNKCQMNANWAKFLYEWECWKPKLDLSNCESYFDWCNNCSVVDWVLSACTLMYCEKPTQAKCTKYKPDLSNCESYFDWCNNCSVVDWKISWCTKMYCKTNTQAKCIKTKSIGMANPASKYCVDKWFKNVLRRVDVGPSTMGVAGYCIFSDGSECEERAYFRWECNPTSPIEKYLSWYLSKNSSKFPDTQSKITFLQNLKNKFSKTYKSIEINIQNFIETLYFSDYEKKKFTLELNWNFISFSLHIPKTRKNKYSEHTVLDPNSGTLVFKYNQSKLSPNMIFSITAVSNTYRENLIKKPLLNTDKIIQSDWYVFYYSQSLDMPYTGKYADEYGSMIWDIKNIIQTFKLIQ